MLSTERFVISDSLMELGLKVLSSYARKEQCKEVMKGYVAIIVRHSFKKNRKDVQDMIIRNGILTRPEFFLLLSKLQGVSK